MRTDEAINRMEIFVRDASEVAPELLDDAIRLGIEALKRIQHDRKEVGSEHYIRLKGETEEV